LFEICCTRCIVSVCFGSKRYQKKKSLKRFNCFFCGLKN